MSACIHRNCNRLKFLYKSPPHLRKVILNTANDDFINALCEVALNVLQGRIPLTTSQYRRLKKEKAGVRLLADKRIPHSKKRRVINQTGAGILLPLLGAALPFITSLFTRSG